MKRRAPSPRSPLQRIFTSCLLAWLLALGAPFPRVALAGPEGGKVVRGKVKIEKVGDTTVIHASDKSIIKFKSFDIGAGETVQFVQPGKKASVLNRISGAKPTTIEGALLANGRVYLVNKAGVYFAPGAEIRVAEIVAAAGHISNRDFVSGVDRFSDLTGSVQNAGSIHADAAKLVGATVANSGFISAENAIVMVSGTDVLLGQRGSRLYVKVGSTAPSDATAPGVAQSGELSAEGGQVLLAAGDSLGMAIEHSGTTRAAEIELAGGQKGVVEVSGTLDASDLSEGGTGGRIEVTGERIALRSAELDASGDQAGGEVLVGGDYQGKGDVRTADVTFADPDTHIAANAVSDGDGGKVILWADGVTGFHGEIDARGGEAGGDGGFVEVSGKQVLFFHGDVDTSAPQGEMGLLLLDPVNVTIANGTGDGGSDGTNTFAGDPSGITGTVNAADTAPTTIYESELEGLAASTNVVVQASNSLAMQDLSDNVLALSTQTGGSVAFTGTGSFSMNTGDTIRTEGASISITGGSVTLGNLSTRGATGTVAGGGVSINATGTSDTTIRSVDAGAGTVFLVAGGGSLLDDGNAATRVTAGGLIIQANGAGASVGSAANPLGTNIGTATTGTLGVSATTGSGGVFISEADGLLLNNINGGTTKNVSLTAELGSITTASAAVLLNGSTLNLTANAPSAGIGAGAAPIRTNFTGAVNATTNNGNVFLASAFPAGTGGAASATPLIVGAINAGSGNVTLTGNTGVANGTLGSIVDDGNASTRITGANLTMTANQNAATIGSAANPIGTHITGTLTASAPNGGATGGAGIYVSEQDGLVVGAVNASIVKDVTLTAEAGSISDDGSGPTGITAARINLNANGTGTAGIGTTAAPIRVTSPGALNATASNGTGGVSLVENGSATDPLLVGAIDGGNGSVLLRSESGSIFDDGSSSTSIAGNGLTLQATAFVAPTATVTAAAATIGTSSTPIATRDIGSLTATSAGAMFVTQTQGGDLTLGPITSSGVSGFPGPPGSSARAGISGGVTIRNDGDGVMIVNAPITTFLGPTPPASNNAFTLPGSVTLDSDGGIEFGVASLTAGGNLSLNANVDGPEQPVLATIYRKPGTSGDPAADRRDLTLTANRGSLTIGENQIISVPGALTLNAINGSPAGPSSNPGFIPGAVTVGDLNALEISISGQRGVVHLRNPRALFQQDGSVVSDGGVDWVANTITVNVGGGMTTQGSGPLPTFSTADGSAVANAPSNTRFGTPFVTVPLEPASFLGVGDPGTEWNGQVLDFRGTGGSIAGTPDAVAPYPYPIVRDDGRLDQQNAEAAALRPVWGMDLLAYLRCSTAPGDDPDDIPLACLGYDPQRAPLSGPEASAARTDYRQLLAVRDELRTDLHEAFDAYRAQAPDAPPSGADFRRFVEESPEQGEASNALHSLRDLLDSIDGMLGPERAGGFQSWERDLLLDFTPGNMTPDLLYEATGAGASRVQTAWF